MTTKKKKRKPSRSIAIVTVAKGKVKARYLSSAELRRTAEADFLKDPDSSSIDWHFNNGEYIKYVAIDTFRGWAKKGEWVKRRISYWEGIQDRLLAHLADKILDQKLAELEDMQEVRDALVKMLKPLRDQTTGKIIVDEVTGLPKFAVELPPFDRLAKAFLDIDLRIGLRTGDVTSRIESINSGSSEVGALARPTDPVVHVMSLSKTEAEKMARGLLTDRNQDLESDIIDVEAATDEDPL